MIKQTQRRSNDIEKTLKRKYLTITDIQKEYLNASKKKIRSFVKKYLPGKTIGGRMFVDRDALERLLSDPGYTLLPLD